MLTKLEFDQFAILAKNHKRIVLFKEQLCDFATPVQIYTALESKFDDVHIFETRSKEDSTQNLSHFLFNPSIKIKAKKNKITIFKNNKEKTFMADPFSILEENYQKNIAKNIHPLINYAGGILGILTYDFVHTFEKIPDKHTSEPYDLYFNFYESCITYIHHDNKIIFSIVVETNNNDSLEFIYHQGYQLIDGLIEIINTANFHVKPEAHKVSQEKFYPSIRDECFITKVNQAKDYIKSGDAFQIVLSRKFKKRTYVKPFKIYRAMRLHNLSPYSFYLKYDDYVVCGSSPEKFISIQNGIINSCPLAGTKAFNTDDDEFQLSKNLLQDEKEIAEHMMLVDLARNDLGRVCQPSSIVIKYLKKIEKFKCVMHISSTVQGKLSEDKNIFDALKASFPAGTLSGAPKIRAMEIIDELETSHRGFYGGAVCAIDNHGDLDSCIAIRMAVMKSGVVELQTGAGIVADSLAVNEMQETYHKAKAVMEAIQQAEAGYL